MNIKVPKLRIIRPAEYQIAAESIIRTWVKASFWLSPLAVWKGIELLNEFLGK